MKLFIAILRTRSVLLPALLYTILFSIYGCSDTVGPEKAETATFIVQTQFRQPTDTASTAIPLPNVRITIRRLAGPTTARPTRTNIQGQAILRNEAIPTGEDFLIEAYSELYGTRLDTLRGACDTVYVNFAFTSVTTTELNCNTLADTTILFLFTDNRTASEELQQNSPNPLINCLPVATNTGSEPMELSIPTGTSGVFTITGIQVNDGNIPITGNPTRVLLNPGATLTLCSSVNTSAASNNSPNGRFEETIPITVQCSGKTSSLSLNLRATVKARECRCDQIVPVSPLIFRLGTPVKAGFADTLSATVLTNTASCALTLEINSMTSTTGRNEWRILSPTEFTATGGRIRLEPDQTLVIVAEFRPQQATSRSAPVDMRIDFDMLPEGGPAPCPFRLTLSGESCNDMCPSLRLNGTDYPFGSNPVPRDSLYIREDKRVFISDLQPSRVRETYNFVLSSNDSLVCGINNATLRMEALQGDAFSLRYFELDNERITLRQNSQIAGSFTLTFTAPTKPELDNILRQRNPGGAPKTADSMFTVRIIITVSGCPPLELLVDAIVTTLPDFTPPIKLHAYRQTTDKQPRPEYEYYIFGEPSVSSLRKNPTPPPNDPDTGDIWVDVTNRHGSPQDPFFRIESNIGWQYWKTIPDESFFNDVRKIVTDVETAINTGNLTFPNSNDRDITAGAPDSLGVGAVYVFELAPDRYAVLVVREINDGSETNLNKQSAIHYRVLYPVLL